MQELLDQMQRRGANNEAATCGASNMSVELPSVKIPKRTAAILGENGIQLPGSSQCASDYFRCETELISTQGMMVMSRVLQN